MFDAIIIGGSYSGLSAAMCLGRSLRKTLVIDAGKPCNRFASHSHNFLSRDGETPSEIAHISRKQVEKYESVRFIKGVATKGERINDNSFLITTDSGESFTSKKIIFASGIKDDILSIPGLSECWGKSVIHCPYCHGFELRQKKTGLLGNGVFLTHMLPLIHNLSQDLIVMTNGAAGLAPEMIEKIDRHNIKLFESEISRIVHEDGNVKEVIFKDGESVDLEAIYFPPPFSQNSNIAESLGCKFTELGHIDVDQMQKTSVPGVFACGDCCSKLRSVSTAAMTGMFAGAIVNMDLSHESF